MGRYVVIKSCICTIFILLILVTAVAVPFTAHANVPPDQQQEERHLTTGQENIVLRARQVYEIEWTPLRNVTKWSERGVFRAGETVRGLPYGMPLEANYIPLRTSFSEFLEAVNDGTSPFYRLVSTRTRIAPYYSLDCSAFISWAWGLESRLMTGDLHLVTTNLGIDINKLQVGDALNHPRFHVVLVTEIHYDETGEISAVGIMELDVPQAQFTLYGEEGTRPLMDVNRKYLYNGFSIIRFNDIENIKYIHDCAVPLDGDNCFDCVENNQLITYPMFLNMQSGSQHKSAIEFISQRGNLNNSRRDYDLFDYNLTRGMFIEMLSKFDEANIASYSNSVFEDVPIDEWYGKAITWAADIGIIDTSSNRFEPRKPISNEEMANIMLEYIIWRGNRSPTSAPLIIINNNT